MKKLLLGIIVILVFSTMVKAQVSRFQAMYIYNFSRMVEWPEEYKNGNFIIGVIGNKPLMEELKSFTTGKKSGNQNISVINFNSASEINKCHILFVGNGGTNNFSDIMSKISGFNTLVISESSNLFEKGAAISFTVVDDKLKYYLNVDNAINKGLKVSSSLENMALANK